MKKSIVEAIERELSRRSFLRRIALVTGAFMTGLLVAPKPALAKPPWGCCNLCFTDPFSCSWPPDCACVWCWVCEETNDCFYYKCSECIMTFYNGCSTANCRCWETDHGDVCRTCDGVVCSAFIKRGKIPGCVPP
jgi:hypothetical protein